MVKFEKWSSGYGALGMKSKFPVGTHIAVRGRLNPMRGALTKPSGNTACSSTCAARSQAGIQNCQAQRHLQGRTSAGAAIKWNLATATPAGGYAAVPAVRCDLKQKTGRHLSKLQTTKTKKWGSCMSESIPQLIDITASLSPYCACRRLAAEGGPGHISV